MYVEGSGVCIYSRIMAFRLQVQSEGTKCACAGPHGTLRVWQKNIEALNSLCCRFRGVSNAVQLAMLDLGSAEYSPVLLSLGMLRRHSHIMSGMRR